MPIDMRTHGLNWKQVLRSQDVFVAMVTPAWHRDPLMKRQYAYAKTLGKPIVLLIQAGTPLPADADAHCWRVWETPEELAGLLQSVEKGDLPH